METLITLAALLLALFCARLGLKAGAFTALRGMLGAVFAFLVAMRALFPAARALNGIGEMAPPILAGGIFGIIFLLAWVIAAKFRESPPEETEAEERSMWDRVPGAAFGFVTGSILAMVLLTTAALVAPKTWPAYHRESIPLPLDSFAQTAYRFVETRIARVPEGDAARTKLPVLEEAKSDDPMRLWR